MVSGIVLQNDLCWNGKNSPNKEATTAQYRKRFKRLIAQLEKHSSELSDIFIVVILGSYYWMNSRLNT